MAALGIVLAVGALEAPAKASPQSCSTMVVSYDDAGVQAAWPSRTGYRNCLSTDGRLIAFSSQWSLMAADGDTISDVYVRDRAVQTLELVSVSSSAIKGNAASTCGDITPDGRYVSFSSDAFNLVTPDTNGAPDVFVRDRITGQTRRVSVGDVGQQGSAGGGSFGGSMSADGRFVVFWSFATNLTPGDTNNTSDVFLYDQTLGTAVCLSAGLGSGTGNAISGDPVISADGRCVAFGSSASNLVVGDANGFSDGFVYDRLSGSLSILTLTNGGGSSNSHSGVDCISADGRFVGFVSGATNLVTGDTNNRPDVFVRDRTLGTTSRVSVSSSGVQGDLESSRARISANGRFIAFESAAKNFFVGDGNGWDIFIHDAWLHTTTLVSQSTTGVHANNQCLRPSISPDGTCVAFDSDANNLIQGGDTNSFTTDVMVRECPPAGAFTYCVPKTSSIGCIPAINGAGTASSSSALPFDVHANGVINRKNGLLTYSVSGQTLVPFGGGALCVAPPLKRSPLLASGGSLPPAWDCSGSFHFDFNAHIQSGVDPALVQG
ncbi:MAG: hypothetical protein IT392_13635, partial [Nitrospirae bacterium]|nr:hypothetical protein [Nitrospirota bacterium]